MFIFPDISTKFYVKVRGKIIKINTQKFNNKNKKN